MLHFILGVLLLAEEALGRGLLQNRVGNFPIFQNGGQGPLDIFPGIQLPQPFPLPVSSPRPSPSPVPSPVFGPSVPSPKPPIFSFPGIGQFPGPIGRPPPGSLFPIGKPSPSPGKPPMLPVLPPPGPTAPPTSTAEAVNKLGFDLLKEFRNQKPTDNVVFSPLSISSAFGLLYFGAMGTTRSELEDVFGFQNGDVPRDLLNIAGAFGEGSDEIATIANRVYVDNEFEILQSYIQAVGQQLIQRLDFGQSEASTNTINQWVENLTRGLITDLIPRRAITEDTRLVLVNAIYFKGLWEVPFNKDNTVPLEFRGAGGNTKTVDFMTIFSRRFLTKDVPELDSRILELPYEGDRFSMFILLPNSDDGFSAAEAGLANNLNLFEGLSSTEFSRIQIPKWELELSLDGITNFLMNLGVRAGFSNQADLSGISSTSSLAITQVVHKARIIVDEEGTEAAAATGIVVGVTSVAPGPPPPVFVADRPFVYFIVDKQAGQIFFQGTVTSFD